MLLVFISEAKVIDLACWTSHGPSCPSPTEKRDKLRTASSLTSQAYTVKSQDVFNFIFTQYYYWPPRWCKKKKIKRTLDQEGSCGHLIVT